MEILTIILASLIGIVSPVGVILDRVFEGILREHIYSAEKIDVRVDNTPSYAAVSGHLDHLMIAARGIEPIKDLRLHAFEIETDPIDISLEKLKSENLKKSLLHPLQGGIRLEIKENDINKALSSPTIKTTLQQFLNRATNSQTTRQFEILNVSCQFIDSNTVAIATKLKQGEDSKALELTLESKIKIVDARSLQLIEPSGTLNGRKLSSRLLKGFADGLNEKLDLSLLAKNGFMVRILQLKIEQHTLHLAVFVRLEADK
jgi:hypothetical protein